MHIIQGLSHTHTPPTGQIEGDGRAWQWQYLTGRHVLLACAISHHHISAVLMCVYERSRMAGTHIPRSASASRLRG